MSDVIFGNAGAIFCALCKKPWTISHICEPRHSTLIASLPDSRDSELLRLRAENARLRAAVEEYLLWEPRNAGHAEAHRRLRDRFAANEAEA